MIRIVRMTAVALIAICGLGRAGLAQDKAAQDKPQGEFQGKVNVNEVLLDVLVTDARGNVIVGLDKNDFVVKENGRPVDLSGVAFYSNRQLMESSPTLAKKGVSVDQGTEDRYFILFFEDQKVNAQDSPQLLSQQLEAAKRARGWVDGEMLVNDWVAVVSYDSRLKVQQDFTHDRKALIAAIGDAMKGRDREGNYPSRIDATKGPSLLAGMPKGDELANKTPKIYSALQVLARSAGNIRGRKNLILFTYGLPSQETTTFGQFIPDKRYFLPTVDALNANNVAVYSLDLTPPAVQHPLSDTLNKLSDDTGGRYFFNVTNFSTPLDQIAKENNGYYLLSYQSDQPAGKTGFQNVTVTTTNPEFRVKARKGYELGK
ncbi:MAG TPA: VWA domain-containing protein [Thermoanaerobaculia bacterium]